MNLTHDHVLPRDLLADRADLLENLRFLCYRDNQSRHWEHGGALELGTAAACIYLLITRKPRTLAALTKLGRDLGLTQSDQRFEETWALAVYLYLQGRYELDEIHKDIDESELKKFGAYYRAANEYFDKLAEDLKHRYATLLPTIETVQLLVTTRAVKPNDRKAAARDLGILDKPGVQASAEKKRITDQDRRIFLEAVSRFSPDEIEQIVADKKVALYHFLDGAERQKLLTEIEKALATLRGAHGVKDEDATPRTG